MCMYLCAVCVYVCVPVVCDCLCDDCVPLIMQVSIKFTHTQKYLNKHKKGFCIVT